MYIYRAASPIFLSSEPANLQSHQSATMISSAISIFLLGASTFLVNAAPLCPETIDMAGGGLPNTTLPSVVSKGGIREIQLAQFLENLEVDFFTTGFMNLTDWGTAGYSEDSVEVVGKIAAVRVTCNLRLYITS
jgi:hypothetical protein